MTQGSALTGAFLDDESCAGEGGEGYGLQFLSAGDFEGEINVSGVNG